MCNLYSVTRGQKAIRDLTKAMPVCLLTEQDRETWMTAPWEYASDLQEPLPDGALRIVATGTREDL